MRRIIYLDPLLNLGSRREEIIFGKDQIISGAELDIEQATKLARAMVTRWGFRPSLAP